MMKRIYSILLIFCMSPVCCAGDLPAVGPKEERPAVSPNGVHVTSVGELNRNSAINSHMFETGNSRLELDRRTLVKLGNDELKRPLIAYPRVKKLHNGRFMLMYQGTRIGADIFWALSDDGMKWEYKGKVFERRPTVNGGGEQDDLRYSSADAIVLRNGDILAISPFRCNKGYYDYASTNGISVRRSTDNGETWGEEEIVFIGTNWEPSALQLPSGEIHVYFTDNDPTWRVHDSGTSLLRSLDNGHTWESQCHIIRQYRTETSLKKDPTVTARVYTDQMPVSCLLNGTNKTITALESMDADDKYFISLAWNDDNWAHTLVGDDVGPAERQNNAFDGCAPYIAQFPSGETVLAYNIRSFFMRIGDAQGKNFAEVEPFEPFGTVVGYWGAIEMLDSHTVMATVPDGTGCDSKTRPVLVGRLRLNHRIDAPFAAVEVDGDNADWADNTDALFIGSESQAQVTFRFAYDEDNVYLLAECLDRDITVWDKLTVMFGNGKSADKAFRATVSVGKNGLSVDRKGIAFKYTVIGTLNDQSDEDEGYVLEMAIPKKMLAIEGGRLFFNADLVDDGLHDGFTGVTEQNAEGWMPVVLK